ncbi:MAG: STAS domain-containing protein [Verrucomicrobia bacterium]|nr:STAS domain-containing protein [Verrucomicrobiota bacterium]
MLHIKEGCPQAGMDWPATEGVLTVSEENSGIKAGQQGDDTLIRVEGKATHTNSHLLKQFMLQCLDENRRNFRMDLSRCTYMDSTFLGTLAGLGGKVRERTGSAIKLLNPAERVRGMLENLGIIHLFETVNETDRAEPLQDLGGKDVSNEARLRGMLEAHEKLAAVSSANEEKFRDVIEFLKEKVRKNSPS